MKKILLTLIIAAGSLSAFAAENEVNPKVLNAFSKDFKAAKEVVWSINADYYRATFTYNEKHVFAYYNMEGELLALTRYVSPNDLPMLLQSALKTDFSNYWISDLFEVANSSGTSYYVTLENADAKLVLKSTDANTWSRFSKTKKS